ncbi:formyltransferase family protein [Paenibacillus hodogayensis]|uniref:Formyltransferase family protein n=1 Tax=Paenibacillus hodogayensis TaxID=279208 RepID=A0ABV5W8X4_9BACL
MEQDNMKKSVILFGSMGPAVSILEWLLENPIFEVKGVVCSKEAMSKWRESINDRDMQEIAPTLGVPILNLEDVVQMEADIGLAIRFHLILRKRHLSRFRLGVVNLHGAPLPELRGVMGDAIAILEGRADFGPTLHWMDEGIDTGDILAEDKFPISENYTVYDLFQKCNEAGIELVKSRFQDIVNGKVVGASQEKVAAERKVEARTFTRKKMMRRKQIDLSLGQEQWRRVAKAFQFPGQEPAYIETPDGRIYLTVDERWGKR